MNLEEARKILWLPNYQRSTWLNLVHKKLVVAVHKTYGWPGGPVR